MRALTVVPGREGALWVDLTWLDRLVSRRVPLASFHDAFQGQEDDVKVVITLGDGQRVGVVGPR